MPTIADLQVKYSADTAGLQAGTQKAQGLVSGLTSGIGGLKTVAGGILLGGALGGVAMGVGQLAAAGLTFESNMANVNSIAQLSTAEIAALSNSVINIAKNPMITEGPSALAAGLYDIYSSGFQGADGLMILEQAAMAGTAGLTSTATASRAITSGLNAFGYEADQTRRVSDVMFQTVNKGVLTFDQLANNLGNTMPIANSLGLEIEDLGAAYALMTLKGVSAAQAETQIAGLMRSTLNPTAELTAAVGEYGYASAEAAISAEGFGGFLKMVMEQSGGSKEALMDMLGTQEAVNAALILGAGDGEEYNAMLEEMMGASEGVGATQKALEKQMQSSRFRIQEARKQLEIFAVLAVGMLSPAISAVASAFSMVISQGIIPFATNLQTLMDSGLNPVEAALRIVQRALGDIGGENTPAAIAGIARAFGDAAILANELGDALGDVIDAFQDLVAGDFDGFMDELGEAATTAVDAFSAFGGQILGELQAAFEAIPWGTLWDTAMGALRDVVSAAPVVLDMVLDAVIGLAGKLLGWANNGIDWVLEQFGIGGPSKVGQKEITVGSFLLDGAVELGGMLKAIAANAAAWVMGKMGTISNALLTVGSFLLDGAVELGGMLKAIALNVGSWVMGKLGTISNALLTVGSFLLDGAVELGGMLKAIALNAAAWVMGKMGAVSNALLTLGSFLAEGAVELGGTLKAIVLNVAGWVNSQIPAANNATLQLGSFLADASVDFTGWLIGVLADFYAAVKGVDWFGTFRAALGESRNLGQAIGEWIREAIGSVADFVADVDWSRVADTLIMGIPAAITALITAPVLITTAILGVLSSAALGVVEGLAGKEIDFSGVAGALSEAIVSAIEGMVGFAAAIKQRLLTEFNEAKPTAGDLGDMAGDIASALMTAIPEGIRAAVGFAAGVKAQIVQEFHEAVPSAGELGEMAADVAGAFWDALKDVPPDIPDWANPANWPGLIAGKAKTGTDKGDLIGGGGGGGGGGFDAIFQPIINAANAARQAVVAAFTNMQIEVATAVTNTGISAVGAFASVQQGLTNAANATRQAVGAAFVNMQIEVAQHITNTVTSATAAFLPLVQALTNNANMARQAVSAAFINMQIEVSATLTALVASASAQALAMGAQINVNLTQGLNAAKANVQIITAEMTTRLNTFRTEAQTAGLQAGQTFNQGLTQGLNAARANTQIVMGQIKAAMNIGSQFSVGHGIGYSLGQGINAGIAAWTSAIAATASAAVTAAVVAARAAAESSSPSKKMMRLGIDLMKGAQIGVNMEADRFIGATADAVRHATNAGGSVGIGGRVPAGALAGGRSGGDITIVTLDAARWAEYLHKMNRGNYAYQQMTGRSRELALGPRGK